VVAGLLRVASQVLFDAGGLARLHAQLEFGVDQLDQQD
jgi:hypothetical protein